LAGGDSFATYAKNAIPAESGYYDVILHGNSNSVKVVSAAGKIHYDVSPRVLARYIRMHPDYFGQNIRLISCETGSTFNGYASELAIEAGVSVKAPTEVIWAAENGWWGIYPVNPVTGLADTARPGTWGTFRPYGWSATGWSK
jgi:filamentous hemagglutinin